MYIKNAVAMHTQQLEVQCLSQVKIIFTAVLITVLAGYDTSYILTLGA